MVLLYPLQKARWSTGARIFVGPGDTALAMQMRPAPTGTPTPAMNLTVRREVMSGLRSGDYYVVAVDDLEPDESRDPQVLDKLRTTAVRVTLAEGTTQDVPLRRVIFADVMSRK